MARLISTGQVLLAVFASVATLADAPPPLPSEAAKAYLDQAIALLEEKHINRDKVDWPEIKAKAHEQINVAQSTADTYPAIRGVLAALNERHSFLIPPRGSISSPQPKAAALLTTTPAEATSQPLPRSEIISGTIGLVWLPPLNTVGEGGEAAAKAYKDTLVTALRRLDEQISCGWIVDLRNNGGGNMYPMLNSLDPILGNEPLGYFVSKAGTVPWVRSIHGIVPAAELQDGLKPLFELKYMNAPVAVLIGPGTASSGEMVALAFVGRNQAKSFGGPTAGLTTGNTVHPLKDGANLVITEVSVADRNGKNYVGAILPDELVAIDDAQDKAAEWLTGQCQKQASPNHRVGTGASPE
jgi:carboxyl-terminal processing protease